MCIDGALQGFVKEDMERGLHPELYCVGKDDPGLVQRWRRSWHTVPPLLDEDDPRRLKEIAKFKHYCDSDGKDYLSEIPRGESLQQVARNRIRPFLREIVSPIMDGEAKRNQSEATSTTDKWNGGYSNDDGGTALIVAHANSLRALIGVICNIDEAEDDVTNATERNDDRKKEAHWLQRLAFCSVREPLSSRNSLSPPHFYGGRHDTALFFRFVVERGGYFVS